MNLSNKKNSERERERERKNHGILTMTAVDSNTSLHLTFEQTFFSLLSLCLCRSLIERGQTVRGIYAIKFHSRRKLTDRKTLKQSNSL